MTASMLWSGSPMPINTMLAMRGGAGGHTLALPLPPLLPARSPPSTLPLLLAPDAPPLEKLPPLLAAPPSSPSSLAMLPPEPARFRTGCCCCAASQRRASTTCSTTCAAERLPSKPIRPV
jgi:hypothetical protein